MIKVFASVAIFALLTACSSAPPKLPTGTVYTPTQCGVVKTDSVAFLTKTCETQLQLGAEPRACGPLREEFGKVINQAEQQIARMVSEQKGADCRDTIMTQINADMEKAAQAMQKYQAKQLDDLIPPQCARENFGKLDALTKQCNLQLAEPGNPTACSDLEKELKASSPSMDRAYAKNRLDASACTNAIQMQNSYVGKALEALRQYDWRREEATP